MKPTIKKLGETKLIGNNIRMSFANNKTTVLWQNFMPRRKEITNSIGTALYSIELYGDPEFFRTFSPMKEFEKWAAIQVSNFDSIPEGMNTLTIPSGDYAVFQYKGRPSEAVATHQFIYTQWIPNSEYQLDDRPHFAVMGENYKGEHPDSEEDFWIPIRKK
jgi:AraC family transcriptional regulator